MRDPNKLLQNHSWDNELLDGLMKAANIASRSYFKDMVLRLVEGLELGL